MITGGAGCASHPSAEKTPKGRSLSYEMDYAENNISMSYVFLEQNIILYVLFPNRLIDNFSEIINFFYCLSLVIVRFDGTFLCH